MTNASNLMWTRDLAIALCCKVEQYAPTYGCHVALTGGTLYRDGERKDCDILFYRIRQAKQIDIDGLFACLRKEIDFVKVGGFGWCHKAVYLNRNVDCLFPEEVGGDYDLIATNATQLAEVQHVFA